MENSPFLTWEIAESSATILNDVFYNIGGVGFANSVNWLDSVKPEWNSFGQTDFSDHYYRDTKVVKNKIVSFGSWNEDKASMF